MDVWTLVPVPIGQAEFRMIGQFLADPFEIEQIGAVPIEEVVGPVFAEVEAAGDRAVYLRLSGPTARIARRKRLHCRDRLLVQVDAGIHLRRAGSQAPPDGAVADGFGELLAPTQASHEQRDADESESLDKDSSGRF